MEGSTFAFSKSCLPHSQSANSLQARPGRAADHKYSTEAACRGIMLPVVDLAPPMDGRIDRHKGVLAFHV